MKSIFIIITCITALFLTSCISSLHPIITADKIITDNRITGSWSSQEGEYLVEPFLKSKFFNEHKSQLFGDSPPAGKDSLLLFRSYVITYNKEGIKYELLGALTRIGQNLFMNLIPINSSAMPGSYDNSLDPPGSITTYTIAKIEISNNNSLVLHFIDGGFVYDQVIAGRMKIKHEKDDLFDTFIITASTAELRQFLEKYGHDKRIFSKENGYTFTRKK
ncbi:MAG TPA: hypothetical protein VFX58_10605 [Chitinophagaceae bacterium]|nr:hypothetical protein [Chitinophagaceae bacterium]